MIELPDDLSVVILDMVESLCGPMSAMQSAKVLREARYVLPRLIAGFAEAEVEPNEVTFPVIPLLVPGEKADPFQ